MHDVVYKDPCLGDGRRANCDLNYIGQPGRKAKVRTGERVDDIKTSNENVDLEGTTALVHHYYESGHVPDMDKFSILEVKHKRKVFESLHILTNSAMKFRKDTENSSAGVQKLNWLESSIHVYEKTMKS